MRILAFSSRPEESPIYERLKPACPVEIRFIPEVLNAATAQLARGFDGVIITTACIIDGAVADALRDAGVKYILSRGAGTDHMDVPSIRARGLRAAYVPAYSPNAISEHTVMLLLMLLRHMKREMRMVDARDFSLTGLRGREVRELTVGVYGAGRIGGETIKALKGFGCRVMAHSIVMSDEVRAMVTPVSAEELFHVSDALIFHANLSPETRHIVNRASIASMKKGVILINTARGALFDGQAVLEGLKSGRIGAVGMDVYEGEEAFVRKNLHGAPVPDAALEEMLSMENVIFTAHMSFNTETAVANMIETSVDNGCQFELTGECRNELT